MAENVRLRRARRNPYRTFSGACSWNPKPPKRSRKGLNGGSKWEFTEEEVQKLLKVLPNLRDQVMVRLGVCLGLRISELLSRTIDDCLDEQGAIKDVLIIPSCRLKGGKEPKPKAYVKEEGHVDGCLCHNCQLVDGKITPKPRRMAVDDYWQTCIACELAAWLRQTP